MMTETTDFAIADLYSGAEEGLRLVDVLSDSTATTTEVDSIETAASSNAAVLVLSLSRQPRNAPASHGQTLEALRNRKVIGIGRGAAQLFGWMDLEICSDRTCDFSSIREPELVVEADGEPPVSFVACRLPVIDDSGPPLDDNFAVFAPAWETASVTEVIARLKVDPNYAPIVRQANHTLVGISSSPETWTPAYREFFSRMAQAVLAAPAATPTSTPREISPPGVCQFTLAECGSLTARFRQDFYFSFRWPTRFSARLTHDSSQVMLAFYGSSVSTSSRHDSDGPGQPLETSIGITEAEINSMDGRYWSIGVTNFELEREAECCLSIDYAPAALRPTAGA